MDRITKLEDRKYEKLKIHCVAIYIAWRLLNDFSQGSYVVQNGLQLLHVLLSLMPPYQTLKEETWTPLQSQFFWLWLLTFIINDKICFKIRVLYKIPKSLLVCKKGFDFSLFLYFFLLSFPSPTETRSHYNALLRWLVSISGVSFFPSKAGRSSSRHYHNQQKA